MTLLKNKKYCSNLACEAKYHWFWREQSDDAIYNTGGGITRAANGSSDTYVGSEFDLLLNWQIDNHISRTPATATSSPATSSRRPGRAKTSISFMWRCSTRSERSER